MEVIRHCFQNTQKNCVNAQQKKREENEGKKIQTKIEIIW